MTDINQLLKKYPLISNQVSREDVAFVLSELQKIIEQNVAGDIVEFGCYSGTTSLFIRRLLDGAGQSEARAFHVYDSFEGLPAKNQQDASAAGVDFKAGELTVSKKQLLQEFRKAGLRAPIAHKGWFEALRPDDAPEHIAFAFLDGDFYSSIASSLKLVWPRMAKGGVILIDDYQREALPGVERAVHDFFSEKSRPKIRVSHNIARLTVS